MNKKRKFTNSLIKPIFNAMIALIMVLSAGVGIAGYYEFSHVLKEQYGDVANGIGQFISMGIDTSKFDYYLETQTPDDDYNQTREMMMKIVESEDCQAIYVAKVDLETNERVYIYNASQNPDDVNIYKIGYRYSLNDNFRDIYDTILAEEETSSNSSYTGYDKSFGSYTHSIYPIRDGDNVIAVIGVVKSMSRLDSARHNYISRILLIELILAIITGVVWIIFMRKTIVIPIQNVSDAAENMVEHLEDGTAPEIIVKRNDEIKQLADSFTMMYSEIGEYINKLGEVTAEKERIGAELDVAAKIQTSMLPCIFPAFPNIPEIDIYATMDPAKEVGGDFYDFFMVDDHHLAFVVADVSGKGVPAALFMVIGKTLIKDHTEMSDDLGEVFTKVNNILCSSNSEEMFITAFEGVLNIRTGELRYVNAGHETPFICRKNGKYEPFKVKNGFVLAGMEGIKYKGGSLQLEPGDKIFQYSDGVPEATNIDLEQYGMNRLGKVLANNSNESPTNLLGLVKADVDSFVGNAEQFDDITMLCLEYRGAEE